MPFKEFTDLSFLTVADEDSAYAFQEAPDCSTAILPQDIENSDGKRVMDIPDFDSMTKYMMSKEGADKRLVLYSYLNELLHKGRLSRIVCFPVLNKEINRQA